MRRVGLIGVVLLVFVGCNSRPPEPTTFEYKDAVLAYALTLPVEWTENKGPRDSAYVGSFRRSSSNTLLVSVSRVKLGTSVAEYEALSRRLLAQNGIEMKAPQPMQLAGNDALVVEIGGTLTGRAARGVLYYVVRGDVAMSFELVAVPPTIGLLPTMRAEFEAGLRWLPGRPMIGGKTYDHSARRDGGWRLSGSTWWSPTLGLQVDVSRAVVSDLRNQPLGTLLVASDASTGITYDISSSIMISENGVFTTPEEIFGTPEPAKKFQAKLLGKSVDFNVYPTDNGPVAFARVTHGAHEFDVSFQLADRVEAAVVQPYLDQVKPLTPPERERLTTKSVQASTRMVANDLMFDGRTYRNRGNGLQWRLPEGEWQGRIGELASVLSKDARFVAFDVSRGLLVSLTVFPGMTPKDWQVAAASHANDVASAPHRLKGEAVPVWQTKDRRITMPFVWSGAYFIAEAVVFDPRSGDTIQQARAALAGIAPLEAGWTMTKGTTRFRDPYFGLSVELGRMGRLQTAPRATHLGNNEFLQVFGTGSDPAGAIRAIAGPIREESMEMLSAMIKQGVTNLGQPNTRPTTGRLGPHELSVWTPQLPALAQKDWAARFGMAYANGVGLLINHIGTEAEWKALLKGIEFMPK